MGGRNTAVPIDRSLTDNQNTALRALEAVGTGGLAYGEWLQSSGLARSSFERVVAALRARDLAGKAADGRWIATTIHSDDPGDAATDLFGPRVPAPDETPLRATRDGLGSCCWCGTETLFLRVQPSLCSGCRALQRGRGP